MADTITIDPGQIQAPKDFASQAVVELSSGKKVVGPRANLPALLQDDPGAKEIPIGDDQIAVRLSNGRIAIGPKANILNLAQDDPGVRIVAGSLSSLPSRAITPEEQQQLEEFKAEPTGALGVATGFAKGAVETMKGTLNLAGRVVGKKGAGDEALQGFGGQPLDTEAKNTSQSVGSVWRRGAQRLVSRRPFRKSRPDCEVAGKLSDAPEGF